MFGPGLGVGGTSIIFPISRHLAIEPPAWTVSLSGASDEVPDKQGRVTVPAPLRQYAGLDRDVTVIGAGTRVEIWDSESWNAYLAEQEAAFSETDEDVLPGVF